MPVISVLDAVPGMWLVDDVFSPDGTKLIRRGKKLTRRHLEYLRRNNIREIHVGDPSDIDRIPEEREEDDRSSLPPSQASSRHHVDAYQAHVHREVIQGLSAGLEKLLHSGNVPAPHRQKIEHIGRELAAEPGVLQRLGMIRAIGDGSLQHCVQVMVLALAVAMQMKMAPDLLRAVGKAALLYDIGKCFLDRAIVMKRGPLTPEEFAAMQEHVRLGYAALQDGFDHDIARVALEHHERFDGNGYPEGLANDRVHPFSRIIAVADVYVSLISDRFYRPGYDPHEAIEYMYGAGGHVFDPVVVRALLQVVRLFHVGAVVQLNNGWVGVVKEENRKIPGRPIVEVIMDEQRRPLNRTIDLNQVYQLVIERVLEP